MESYIIKLSEKCRIIDSVYKKVPLHILMVIIETLCNRTILQLYISHSEHCSYREDLKKPKSNFELIIQMFSIVEFEPPPPTPEDYNFDKLKSTLSELKKVKTFLGFSREIVF